jgi:hypothetical protein
MTFDFSNDQFKNLISENQVKIQKRTNSGIHENENFRRLLVTFKTFLNDSPFNSFLAVLITKEDVVNLKQDIGSKVETELFSLTASTNNHIIVDKNFDIKTAERKLFSGNESRRIYREISYDFCVFLISNQGIHYFVNGDDIGETIFYSAEDQDRFNELKSINQLDEIFEEYRKHLKIRNIYSKFFVPNSGKRVLYKILNDSKKTDISEDEFFKINKHLLNNKPEDSFREDLRLYIETNLKGSLLGKEYVMENFKRLDIFIHDDFGELYMIEVKWVGITIHRNGQKIGTKYSMNDINPAGIIQSIDYIRELYETDKKIKLGFLAVFDARNEEMNDTGENFKPSVLKHDLRHFSKKFKKIDDFRVLNNHSK